MKQKPRLERICFIVMLFFTIQVFFMLVMRITSPAHQEKDSMATNSYEASIPISWEIIKSIQNGPIICDRSHEKFDWCFFNRPTILDPNKTTFFRIGSLSKASQKPSLIEKIRPYPRKWEPQTMSYITEVTLTTSSLNKPCDIHHETPALVFSVSGYTGNFFHDFNDGIIPLYVTINTFFPDQHVTLVITNFTNWWYSKYEVLLRSFTKYPVINLNNQTDTHCFPSAVVGLISHGSMTIDPYLQPNQLSFLDFRSQLEVAYSQCDGEIPPPLKPGKPRIVFASRTGNVGRVILNQNEFVEALEEAGFEVVLFKPTKFTYLCNVYNLVNSSHGMIGVHGAALTHSLFLRPGALLFQITPLGTQWLADSYFKNVAKGMKLNYVEYKIGKKESSLAKKYGLDHDIVRDPEAYIGGNWSRADNIYLKGQDVKLDLDRFKNYLAISYSNAKRFMDING